MCRSILKTCIPLITLFIVSGCSTQTKKSDVTHIQKKRIEYLEQQLQLKEKKLAELKAKQWITEPVVQSEELAFAKLKKLIQDKRWGLALQESSRLKKIYPDSVELLTYRYKMFKKLGLNKQARHENLAVRKLLSRQKSQSSIQ